MRVGRDQTVLAARGIGCLAAPERPPPHWDGKGENFASDIYFVPIRNAQADLAANLPSTSAPSLGSPNRCL